MTGNGGDAEGPLKLAAQTSGIRNVPLPTSPITDSGGFRQTADGWTATITGTVGQTGMTRGDGRFHAPRAGSLTGLVVTTSANWSAGSLTVRVYKNTGLAGGTVPGDQIAMGLTLTINNGTAPSRKSITLPINATPQSSFLPGDELYVTIESTSWSSSSTGVRCAIDVET